MSYSDDYVKYRGKCKEYSEELCERDSSLTLVRGYYYCPIWNKEEPHWWCKKQDGTIVDPTKKQFPSGGYGYYREFDGSICCDECGKIFPETDKNAVFYGRYALCSTKCMLKLVGLK